MQNVRAAIDIGTVTCRLLIAEVSANGEVTELFRDREITDLGTGVDEKNLLSPDAIERVGVVIDRFMNELHSREKLLEHPIPYMAVATSASRDAENAADLEARLALAGLKLDIIPGEREAALSFAGASSAFAGERVVVVDSGGGSTEIIAGEAGLTPVKPIKAHSFNVGCRRITERFFQSDPPAISELENAAAFIKNEFKSYVEELRENNLLDARMIAVAGTATSIVSIREQMKVYDGKRVHGSIVTKTDVDKTLKRLSCMTLEERQHVIGLNPGRAPVIVAGVLILQQIMALSNITTFTASERDILHGIVMALH